MSGSYFRFEVEHVFSQSLWNIEAIRLFLEANGYSREMAGNKIALFSDPLFIDQLQKLSPNDPLRRALLDPNSGSGINQHDGGAPTGNHLGKNTFLAAEINAIINSPASAAAKKAALDNLHEWAKKLARGEIVGADGKPMSIIGNTNYAAALAAAYRNGTQASWIDPTAFDDPNHSQRAAADAALTRGVAHYAGLDKTNIPNDKIRPVLVEKISAAFERARLTSPEERAIVEAALKDGTATGTNRAMATQLDAAASRSQLWTGTESYSRLNPDGTVERVRVVSGQLPPGDGWIGDPAAEARASPEVSLIREKIGTLKGQYDATLASAANYTPEGKLKPAALRGLRGLEKALGGLGLLATVLDAAMTSDKVQELNNQGNTAQANEEIAAFAGRQAYGWVGGFLGAVGVRFVGLILGNMLAGAAGGAFAGPIGAILGGLLGAFLGASFGDEFGRKHSSWLSDIFGDLMNRRDPLILDLSLGGGGVVFTTFASSTVQFDLDSNGFAERTGWAGPTAGFVTLDLNGNGLVDNGSELFGNSAQNGFQAIAALDSNADVAISVLDAQYANLRVWRDLNQDGVSQTGELATLADAGVVSISLTTTTHAHTFRNSAQILASGSFTNQYGESREALAVNFAVDRINSQSILPPGFEYDPEVFALPNLRGAVCPERLPKAGSRSGKVPDLWVAANDNWESSCGGLDLDTVVRMVRNGAVTR